MCGGIDVAIKWVPPGAEQALGVDEGVASADFVGIDEFHLDTHTPGHTDVVLVGIDLRLVMRKPHAAGNVIGNRIVRIGGELAIQVDAVTLERDHGLVGAELSNLGRRMPGGTRGELIALEQHDVSPAFKS